MTYTDYTTFLERLDSIKSQILRETPPPIIAAQTYMKTSGELASRIAAPMKGAISEGMLLHIW